MKKQLLLLLVTVFGGLFTTVNPAFAQTWTQTSAPNGHWHSVASSADGTKLVAIGYLSIYTSTNSGATWMQQTNPAAPYSLLSVASSADGTKLVATSFALIYTSTNSGITWTSKSIPSTNLIAVASSADGNKLVVVVGMTPTTGFGVQTTGPIYISTNSGATWTVSGAPTNYWSCVASSADGTKFSAGTIGVNSQGYLESSGLIYVSTDSGTTWTQTGAPTNAWAAIASSADGTKLAAVSVPTWIVTNGSIVYTSLGLVYTSTNSGATWTSKNLPNTVWQAVTSSADGAKLAAVAQNGCVFTSTDFGASWASNSIPSEPCWAMASSADGDRLVVVVSFNGGIWTSQTTPSPQLNIAPSDTSLVLSWIVPSTNFVLQQNSDLTTTNWVDVTNEPTLNLTNLQNQVTLPLPAGNAFYWLRTP